ncbi:MAG TPA: hypothetical protein VGJ19_15905 [Streptosporangiaceae bacterium]
MLISHDISTVAALDGGQQIVISNDSDFGIAGVTNAAASGTTTTSTATVTIHVTSG